MRSYLFPIAAAALLAACTTSVTGGPASSSTPGNAADGGPTGTGTGTTGTTTTTATNTAIAARCLETGEGDTKDGWGRKISSDTVLAVKGNVVVAIAFPITIDDDLRGANHFADGVWDKLLSDEYNVGERTAGGDGAGLTPYSTGTAIDKADGSTVHVMVVSPRNNGITWPIVAISPDEGALHSTFPATDDLAAMRAYNAFPLSCWTSTGTWTTEETNAAATYSASGNFTGIYASSFQLTFALDGAGKYDWKGKLTDNSGVQTENDTGSYTATDYAIQLTSDTGKNKTYDAAFVAVKGGLVLSITDHQFKGNTWNLFAAK